MNLEAIGADARVLGAFERLRGEGLELARVARSQHDQYRLITSDGDVDAEPSGGLWFRSPDAASMPVVGDWVMARRAGESEAIVEAVLPRFSLFARQAAGKRAERQAIAANIDVVFLVCGLDGDFNLRRLERYLALAAESGATPVVVLNKADTASNLAELVRQTRTVAGDREAASISATTTGGIDPLRAFIGYGRTAALLGSSGVGKSTIVNGLLGEARLATGAVRASDSRGRHTTTHRELLPLPTGGAIIDTPGMRELQLWASEDSVDAAFSDIAELAARCRFGNCSHGAEPGCAVRAALEAGELDAARWASYGKLLGEARWHETQVDPNAARERKRKWKQIHKAMRHFTKETRSGRA